MLVFQLRALSPFHSPSSVPLHPPHNCETGQLITSKGSLSGLNTFAFLPIPVSMFPRDLGLPLSTAPPVPLSPAHCVPAGRVPPSSSSRPCPNGTFAIAASLPGLLEWLNHSHPVGSSSKTPSPERVSMTATLSRVGSFRFSFGFSFCGFEPRLSCVRYVLVYLFLWTLLQHELHESRDHIS